MYDEEENQRRLRNAIARSKSVDTSKEVRLRKRVQNRQKLSSHFFFIRNKRFSQFYLLRNDF